jgi:hypothetical protein
MVLQADGQMDFDFMQHNNNECFCITNFWLYLNVELINKFTLFVATFCILNKEAGNIVITELQRLCMCKCILQCNMYYSIIHRYHYNHLRCWILLICMSCRSLLSLRVFYWNMQLLLTKPNSYMYIPIKYTHSMCTQPVPWLWLSFHDYCCLTYLLAIYQPVSCVVLVYRVVDRD